MTKPSEWALAEAIRALLQDGDTILPYQAENVAMALDRARRKGIEEVCELLKAPPWYAGETRLAAISALADKEPSP